MVTLGCLVPSTSGVALLCKRPTTSWKYHYCRLQNMLDLSLRGIFALAGIFTLFISFLRWLKTNVLVMAKVSIYELLWASHGVSSTCANDNMGAHSMLLTTALPVAQSVWAFTFDNSITNVALGLSLRENKRRTSLPDRHDRVPLEPNSPQESSFWCQQGLKLAGR